MTNLDEMQFELLPSENASQGQEFGIGLSVSVDDGGFVPGSTDWAIQDSESSTRGTTAYGRDRLLGPTWSWQLHINELDVSSARKTLGRFATAWRALHIRETPGAVIPIRYKLDGETRRVYGRPRKLDAPPSNLILNGYVPVSVDFRAVDGFVYDDLESTVVLALALSGGSQGGFVFPVTFPVTTLPVGLHRDTVVVGGDAPTYPIVRFDGPVTSPSLTTSDWTMSLPGVNVPAGDHVEVDTRAWKLTALRKDGSSVAGKLSRRTRLVDMKLEPGSHELTFAGASTTGTATCTVRWAAAHNSI